MATGYLVLLWALLVVLGWLALRKPPKGLPPGPRPLTLLGNLLQLGKLPHRSLAELARRHGPLISLRLGLVPHIVVSSPSVAKQVLQKHDQLLSYRAPPDATQALDHAKLSMVMLPPGATWRSLRKICNSKIFATQRLDANQGFRSQKVRELVSFVEQSARAGQPVDVGRAVFTTTLNLLSTTIFSADMVSHDEESSAEFKNLVRQVMIESASPNLSDYFPLLRWADPQGRRRRLTFHLRNLKNIFDRKIKDRLSSRSFQATSNPEDFLDVLLNANASLELDRPAIDHLLVDLFCAGSDTTSTTVEWAMAELLRNPTAMEKARREVAEVTKGLQKETVEESDIGRMPYLQAVVKETLRLHPPVPFLIPRRAVETVELSMDGEGDNSSRSYTVPAETTDPATWGSDADVFLPERFSGGGCGDVDFRGCHMELIPFGAGRRICPGLPLAARMLHLLLANLLWSFDWKLPEGTAAGDISMTENFGIALSKAEPLLAVPVLAQKSMQ
ncbi:unnamed protein product [Spirodela intermedia]|uniref:Uncharacterized protein n=1 Tax=Spirodela intermedia TaxID=51605 RepID=A0A7I8IM99_SPIIN|nr:unnamed protein product [Spirodela intermedia]CAA6659077.1 unnamed protein product [Spirodela intermedia]